MKLLKKTYVIIMWLFDNNKLNYLLSVKLYDSDVLLVVYDTDSVLVFH